MSFNNLLFITYGFISITLIAFVVILSVLLGGRTLSSSTSTVYECGFLPYTDVNMGDAYLFNVFSLFLLFDLEVIITLPIISLFTLNEHEINLFSSNTVYSMVTVLFYLGITLCLEVWSGVLELNEW